MVHRGLESITYETVSSLEAVQPSEDRKAFVFVTWGSYDATETNLLLMHHFCILKPF